MKSEAAEATMAGGNESGALAGSWCRDLELGAGGGGAVRLLLVLSGCFVCGSGTAGQLLRGRVPRVYVQKGGVSPGRGPLFC